MRSQGSFRILSHKTLRVTPAMEAGLTDRVWTFQDVANMIDAATEKQIKRGPYKKRSAQLEEDYVWD
jgi:hypothetical protein